MNNSSYFQPATLGLHTLKNRIVLPPLTRQRSTQPGNVANELMAEYYQQRASAGLLVTEGTQIEPRGQGYAWTPGIHTAEQIAGWRKVTDAVHAVDGVSLADGVVGVGFVKRRAGVSSKMPAGISLRL